MHEANRISVRCMRYVLFLACMRMNIGRHACVRMQAAADKARALCARHNTKLSHVGMRFAYAYPFLSTVICGTRKLHTYPVSKSNVVDRDSL